MLKWIEITYVLLLPVIPGIGLKKNQMSHKILKKISRHTKSGTLPRVAYNTLKSPLNKLKKKVPVIRRDVSNRIKYGRSAPLFHELIWVDPGKVNTIIFRDEIKRVTGMNRTDSSAFVVDWDRVMHTAPLMDQYRIQYCFKHWQEGLPWEELGVFDHMETTKKYGNLPLKTIKSRFDMLDRAFEEARKTGRLKTRKEIHPSNFREKDGVLIHIGKDGEPFFGGNGFHRLAIAKVLKLKTIPACIGIVDKDAIQYLDRYRNPQIED